MGAPPGLWAKQGGIELTPSQHPTCSHCCCSQCCPPHHHPSPSPPPQGSFAFVLYDSLTKRVWAARDAEVGSCAMPQSAPLKDRLGCRG